jgi:anti-anti-sigma factor
LRHADIEPATFACRAQEIAAGVVRIWVTGRIDAEAAPAVGRTLRTAQEAAAIAVVDLRAAFMTPPLLELIEAADGHARMHRRRLVILEQPAAGTPSALLALGLTARIMTIGTPAAPDGAGAPVTSPIARTQRGGRMVVDIVGALDMVIGPELDAELASHAAHGRSLVLDLRAVRFMDSMGIRVLRDAFDRARDGGLGCELLASDAVNRILETAQLRQHFEPLQALAERQP